MTAQLTAQQGEYEQILVQIVQTLPTDRVAELIDFARFLKAQTLAGQLATGESLGDIEADNARWDALFATEKSERLLDKMAKEALEEYEAGQMRPM